MKLFRSYWPLDHNQFLMASSSSTAAALSVGALVAAVGLVRLRAMLNKTDLARGWLEEVLGDRAMAWVKARNAET